MPEPALGATEQPVAIGDCRKAAVVGRDGSLDWPCLIGPFVDAWLFAPARSGAAKAEAHRRFLPPLLAHLDTAGLGRVSGVADGDPPLAPVRCPFQAWSLGEALRAQAMLDADAG